MAASGLGGVDFARRQTQKTPDMPAGLDHRAFTASGATVVWIAPPAGERADRLPSSGLWRPSR